MVDHRSSPLLLLLDRPSTPSVAVALLTAVAEEGTDSDVGEVDMEVSLVVADVAVYD